MLQVRSRDSLSGGDRGWLKAKHHFAPDGQGPHGPLGCLVIWNDDEVAPHAGFPLHGHRDMEIVTYVREGAVAHSDDAGGGGRIEAGHVQAISAGRGIRHAEYNPNDDVLRVFQIWLLPRHRGLEPRWATKPFAKADRAGRLVALASGFAEDAEALEIDADARVLGATLKAGETITYALGAGRAAYLVPTLGALDVNGVRIAARDGVAITDEPSLTLSARDACEFVLVDAGPATI